MVRKIALRFSARSRSAPPDNHDPSFRDRNRWSGWGHRRHAHLEQLIEDAEGLLVPLIAGLRLNRIVGIIQAHGHASVSRWLRTLEDLESSSGVLGDRRRPRIRSDIQFRSLAHPASDE